MLKVGLLVILMLFSFIGFSKKKEPFYPASQISPELKENSNSVVRSRKALLEIISTEKINYTVREIVTILNDNGDKEGILYIPYNSNIKPEIITACFYDADGKLLKKVKNTEIYDQSYFDGFSMYNDARFKRITPQINSYPYTVEYEYNLQFDGIIDYPGWIATDSYNKSVEFSSYEIKVKKGIDIRFKEKEVEIIRNTEKEEGQVCYSWEIADLEALEYEPYSVPLDQIVPYVQISPVEFSYYNVEGNMESWKNYGKWISGLLKGNDILPEERIGFLKELVKDETDDFEKVKKIYEYHQEKNRYVSIQMGIGGFQPFSAEVVDGVSYGDCKALSNYMVSMLKAVGVESFYTVINAGKNADEVITEFPSQVFNHVIVTVPLKKDTLFLECTNKFAPCGYLSDFTSDRYALIINGENSKLIRTKSYDESVNTWNGSASVKISDEGNAEIYDTVVFCGLQYDMIEDEIRKTREKQLESEYKSNDIPGARFLDIQYEAEKQIIPSATRVREIEVARFATTMGDRMFLPVNVLNKRTSVPKKKTKREYSFELKMSFHDSDEVVYFIPDGYEIEYLPEPKMLESEFGKYSSSLKVEKNKIIYTREDLRYSGIFPPEKYSDYVSFSKEIVSSDNQKIVIKKL